MILTQDITEQLPLTVVSEQAPGWKWELLEHHIDFIFTAKVTSPFAPNGKFGSVDLDDLDGQLSLIKVSNL